MKKKVAVTQRVEKNIEYGETRDTLDFEICKLSRMRRITNTREMPNTKKH